MANRSNEGLKALFIRATEFHKAGALDEAERLYRKLLRSPGDQFHVLRLLGHLQMQRRHFEEACKIFGRALRANPGSVEVLINRGNSLMELGLADQALVDYDRAVAASPHNERLLTNRAAALAALHRPGEALEDLRQAIALNPAAPQSYFIRGNVLLDLGRYDDALLDYSRTIEAAPDFVDAHHNRGIALRALNRTTEALDAFDLALSLRAGNPEVLNNRRILLQELGRYEEAVPALLSLLEVAPEFPFAEGSLLDARLHCCDWKGFDEQVMHIEKGLRQGKPSIMPFTLLAVSDDRKLQRRSAEIFARAQAGAGASTFGDKRLNRGKLRVAYLSADFRDHPVALLLASVLEAHDKERFETIGISFGPDDGSPLRRRLSAAFDVFVDMAGASDDQIVSALRERNVDIAIDLMGHTSGHRFNIFMKRIAPIQVNYLGFAGTMGGTGHDYMVADRHVVPEEATADYSEQVIYLPGCYLPCSRYPAGQREPTREQAGLPSAGRVFCALNNEVKISPALFAVWMRILLRVPHSVLWLRQPSTVARMNLSQEAARHGVEPGRLVFAPRVEDHADHVARLRLADVFLDTYPYNAHATAVDALQAGLPVVTRSGSTFASRVAASLMQCAGGPEMIVETFDDYERMAVELALDEGKLATVKSKIRSNAVDGGMFDAGRYCRGLENSFLEMCRRFEPDYEVR